MLNLLFSNQFQLNDLKVNIVIMKELVCQQGELEVNDQTSYFALVTEEWSGQVLKNGNPEPWRTKLQTM